MENSFFKILVSLPIILLITYFIPILGICLIIFRYFVYTDKKYYYTPILLLISSVVIYIPKLLNFIPNFNISYLDRIITSSIYSDILKFDKTLFIISIVLLIISFIFKKLFQKVIELVMKCIQKEEQKDYEIREKNDLVMQEKREKAKNTHFVRCPNCGADNIITSNIGTCKYCRRKIEYKES